MTACKPNTPIMTYKLSKNIDDNSYEKGGTDVYELKYHHLIEDSFTNKNSICLFHGSAIHCWHPIIRHGIKNK